MPDVEDQDEVALSQLASGVKSEGSSHTVTHDISSSMVATETAVRLLLPNVCQSVRLMVHSPPSLRLHQQLSVYRI